MTEIIIETRNFMKSNNDNNDNNNNNNNNNNNDTLFI